MAEQNADEQGSATQQAGRHAAPDEAATTTGGTAGDTAATSSTSSTGDSSSEAPTRAVAGDSSSEAPTRAVATGGPSEAPTQHVDGAAAQDATRQAPAGSTPEPTRRIEHPPEAPQGGSPRGAEPGPTGPRRSSGDARRAVRRVTSLVATVLRLVGLFLALVLVAYVVLTLVGVNPANAVAQLVAEGADGLVLRFRDLFVPADPRLALVVNYGLAALFWLVVGSIAARLVRALGRLV